MCDVLACLLTRMENQFSPEFVITQELAVGPPRTSSLAMHMSSLTLEKTVGSMKNPFKPRALPPHSSLAPSLMPLWTNSSTRVCCSRLIWEESRYLKGVQDEFKKKNRLWNQRKKLIVEEKKKRELLVFR